MTTIITGANGGLGRELASVFAQEDNLILQHRRVDLDPLDFPKSVRETHVYWVCGNLRFLTPLNEIVEHAAKSHDQLILINNAAVHLCKAFDEMGDCEIKDVIETNLIAPMLLTRKLWHLLKSRDGIVVNINSVAGKEAGKFETAYCASKHGLAGFSKALQFDATKDNVRVIDVYIGKMITAMTAGQVNQDKYIRPSDVAELVYQLCYNSNQSYRVNEVTLTRRNY